MRGGHDEESAWSLISAFLPTQFSLILTLYFVEPNPLPHVLHSQFVLRSLLLMHDAARSGTRVQLSNKRMRVMRPRNSSPNPYTLQQLQFSKAGQGTACSIGTRLGGASLQAVCCTDWSRHEIILGLCWSSDSQGLNPPVASNFPRQPLSLVCISTMYFVHGTRYCTYSTYVRCIIAF